MGGSATFRALVLAVLTAAATWSPADAQCRLCSKPTTTREAAAPGADIQLEIQTSLNFDRLIVLGQGEGAAEIHPNGSSAAQGTIAPMSPRAMVGTVSVHGTAGRTVRVELPRRVELYSLAGGHIELEDVSSDLPSMPKLDSAGNLTFRFGGRVRIQGDADGEYRGDLPITVEYQ